MGSVNLISNLLEKNLSVDNSKSIKDRIEVQQTNSIEQQPKNETDDSIKEKDMENMVKDINSVLEDTHTSLKYVYHEKLEKYYVTLIDDETKEIVKEIPPKKLLDIYASMREYLGLFIDNKI
ncbi:flagellar protein FlaG [Robertmurraya yapensis]|uniref:Flagellar protein FlaG n=1 Tax=Bacillus yapensis TaxID=2492960 RepID=A0A431WLA5_9BACI|nr:flagellar protein FlaG [Bacillus yapensis]RTR36362.1 flagellar protein FlaG [Bacillus yapensis]TKT05866.1 flagellar protein FlaG [Bacillus yapensis]